MRQLINFILFLAGYEKTRPYEPSLRPFSGHINCDKCGCPDIYTNIQVPGDPDTWPFRKLQHIMIEHLERECYGCHYIWGERPIEIRTDFIDAEYEDIPEED